MRKDILKSIAFVFFIGIVIYFGSSWMHLSQFMDMEYMRSTINSQGVLAPVYYIILMAAAIVISPIPSAPLAAVAGAIWGPILGSIYSIIGALIGAIFSFLIARHLGRAIIDQILHKHVEIRTSQKRLVWIIFIARLFPVFQFDVISYGAGLTKISLRNFVFATFLGMIPMTLVFSSFGKSLFQEDKFQLGWVSITFSVLLIIALLAVPYLIQHYNLFGLKKKIVIK